MDSWNSSEPLIKESFLWNPWSALFIENISALSFYYQDFCTEENILYKWLNVARDHSHHILDFTTYILMCFIYLSLDCFYHSVCYTLPVYIALEPHRKSTIDTVWQIVKKS